MKKIRRTKIIVETREILFAFGAAEENATDGHFDVCPLCHSQLDEDAKFKTIEISSNHDCLTTENQQNNQGEIK